MSSFQSDAWFFDEDLWRHFHDCMFSAADFVAAEQQVVDLLALSGVVSGRVLDLACGPGRHALPLAARGFDVTAVDGSTYLLDELRQRCESQDLSMAIHHADMRSFESENGFDLVLSMHTSFGYFEDEDEDLELLRRIHGQLRPEGQLLLDVAGKEYIVRQIEPLMVRELGDDQFLIEQPEVFDSCSRLETDWTLVDGDEVHRARFRLRIYSAVELAALCREAGFSALDIYGDLQGTPYDLDSDRLIILARK